MFHRVIHSAAARAAWGLVGVVVFVQGSQSVSRGGILALVVGALLIITAGADVAPGPRDSRGNA